MVGLAWTVDTSNWAPYAWSPVRPPNNTVPAAAPRHLPKTMIGRSAKHIGDEGRLHFIRVKAFESCLYLSEDGATDIGLEAGGLVGGLPLFQYHKRLALAGPGEALNKRSG